MKYFIACLALFPSAALAAAEQHAPQTTYENVVADTATYAVLSSEDAAPRMAATTPCARNVDHILTHLENLMIESGRMSPEDVPAMPQKKRF